MKQKILKAMFAVLLSVNANAQVNSGSNGSDGALDFSAINYSTNIVIDMHDHPTGIYQYTYVNIPGNNIHLSFIPNASNSPVVWLIQSNAVINGWIDVSGKPGSNGAGGAGGPGGFSGGRGGPFATSGQGPGGGQINGGSASYATSYGNQFIVPLIGGSGGAGNTNGALGGGGGGGALLIAATGQIQFNSSGLILAQGGSGQAVGGYGWSVNAGTGSGGSVRLVASQLTGSGFIYDDANTGPSGYGRIRFDSPDNQFSGSYYGIASQGYQPIIIPAVGQGVQLNITSVGGVSVSANPSGVIATPDAVIPGQQSNPVSIVVQCSNLPLNTPITVTVNPASGSPVSAIGYNTTGTLASSTATVSIIIPRGGGSLYATAATSN
jgi:hypothetical protein